MRAAPPSQRATGATAFLGGLLLALALGLTGYWMLFSRFAFYDDEGYILFSARNYLQLGHLYDRVYSQYGPAFYLAIETWQRLFSATLDHTAARGLTLGLWLGTAAGCALLVCRNGTGRAAGLATFAGTFLYLYFIIDEPFHPGSHVIFLLAGSLALSGFLIARDRWRALAVVLGATGAWLTLTKVNVGAFYILAVAGWGILHCRSPAVRGPGARLLVAAILILGAAAVMHSLLGLAWVREYAFIFGVGALSLACVMPRRDIVGLRDGLTFAGSGAAVSALVLAAVRLRGTSLPALIDGLFLGPLRHPANYSYAVDWRPGSLGLGVASLALLAWHQSLRKRGHARADQLIWAVRLLQIAALAVAVLALVEFRAVGAVFSYVTPLIWTWVVPLGTARPRKGLPEIQGLLGTVLLLQFLHAYPVGGSQESWGTFLFFPLAGIGLLEISECPALARGSAWARWATAVFLAACLLKTAATGFAAGRRYFRQEPLELPGTAGLRLPRDEASGYRILALNAAAHADILFSLPGMYSFNPWTDRPAPTEKNTTLWFALLNASEQAEIQRALQSHPGACIIVQDSVVPLMQAGRVSMQGPLLDYIFHEFSPAFRVQGFSFLVRKGRHVAALGIARAQLPGPAGSGGSAVEFSFVSPPQGIATVGMDDLAGNQNSRSILLGEKNFSWREIDGAGVARGPEHRGVSGLPANRLIRSQVLVEFPIGSTAPGLHVRSNSGEIVGEARFDR